MVKDKPAKIEDQTPTSITIKTPDALGDGPWLIVLITQEGEFVAVLSYDPTTNKFLIPHDEEIPTMATSLQPSITRPKPSIRPDKPLLTL